MPRSAERRPSGFDEGLAERVREMLDATRNLSERRMFGGLAFLVGGHMCVGILQDRLMVRVGAEAYEQALRDRHAREMDFTGKPLKGFVYVLPAGLASDAALRKWVDRGLALAASLPPKPPGSGGARSRAKQAATGQGTRRRKPRS